VDDGAHQDSLPFRNGAVPHGRDLFLGLSRARGAITAYKIAGPSPALSIIKVPVL